MNISTVQATEIYNILAEHVGATEYWRDNFVHWMSTGYSGGEYRFQGSLGFGGKFWVNERPFPDRSGFYVNQYQEHETDESLAAIEKANVALKVYWEQFIGN